MTKGNYSRGNKIILCSSCRGVVVKEWANEGRFGGPVVEGTVVMVFYYEQD